MSAQRLAQPAAAWLPARRVLHRFYALLYRRLLTKRVRAALALSERAVPVIGCFR